MGSVRFLVKEKEDKCASPTLPSGDHAWQLASPTDLEPRKSSMGADL
jgi:hypothetical protein